MAKGLQAKFSALATALKGEFCERDAVIEGMICAALAGEHVLLLGPPGTAKSALARAFCAGVAGSQYFGWLLSKFSAPEELFGPISLSALKADRYERVTTGKLPECHVAFLDEIFKANSGVLNSLLTAINEREFHNGAGAVKIPLRMVIGASNELPEGAELGALYDRFLVRYWVDATQSPDAFAAVLMGAEPEIRAAFTLTQWDEARAEVAAVGFDKPAAQEMFKLRKALGEKQIAPSDRRWKRAVRLLKANAWMSGDSEVHEDHFTLLGDVLWDNPEQRTTVAAAVADHVSNVTSEAIKIRDILVEAVTGLPAQPSAPDKAWQDRLVAINREGNRAIKQLQELHKKARNTRQKDTIKASIDAVNAQMGPVRHMAREMLGL